MKKFIYTILSSLMLLSCSKEVKDRTDGFSAPKLTSTDLGAGSWKPILLTRPDTFLVKAPAAVNSPDYMAELNEIRGLQQNLTAAQKDLVKYWSAGAVLRWNEILRGLVAKYNLPPYQNTNGTYPLPSAANPFNYPLFPFSNPPYAARAYAYVSAAQYDALVATWHYKKLYNRPAPYKANAAIQLNSAIAENDLPSYPSEDAVVAGVTAEMMKLLFPTEIAFIEQKLAGAEQARLLAGANVRSDIAAGEALGRSVAQTFTARARVDNAGKAVGVPADWAKMENDCIVRNEIPWLSLESPIRPPMLPLYGNVKAFLFDTATCVALRPGPPPPTGSLKMKGEIEEVYNYIKAPSREQIKIVQFWADGAGTYTPPGHWNAIAAEDFLTKGYSEVRWARNMALLNIALMDAGIVCWNTKYHYYNPRPSQLNPAIKTLTGVPNFPSYISGHSTFSGAAAEILSHLNSEKASQYKAMASKRLCRGFMVAYTTEAIVMPACRQEKVGAFAVQKAKADGAE